MRLRTIAAAVAVSWALSGCFVFIPGSVVGKVSDTLTGDEGEHCVSRGVVVGQKLPGPYGGVYTVKSLSGVSMRCTDPDRPIRAALSKDA